MPDTSDLCVYWRFSEGQGVHVPDLSSHGNDGVLLDHARVSKAPLTANDPVGDEDEWGEKIPLGHSLQGGVCECRSVVGLLDSLKQFTLEFFTERTKAESASESIVIASLGQDVEIRAGGAGSVSLSVFGVTRESARRLPLNQWVHVGLVSSSKKLSLYMDGFPAITGLEFSSDDLKEPSISLRIGHAHVRVTEVRLWSSLRSVQLLKEYMHCALPRVAPTVSRWKGLKIRTGGGATTSRTALTSPSVPITLSPVRERRTRRLDQLFPPHDTTLNESSNLKIISPGHVAQLVVPKAVSMDVVAVCSTESEEPHVVEPISEPHLPQQMISPQPMAPPQGVSHIPIFLHPSVTPSATTQQAVDEIDALMESGLVAFRSDDFRTSKDVFWHAIGSISHYMKFKYRFGPFLSPKPPSDILERLAAAANYFLAGRLRQSLEAEIKPEKKLFMYYTLLRVPLLKQDVVTVTMRAIDAAAAANDTIAELVLRKRLLNASYNDIQATTLESNKLCICELETRQAVTGETLTKTRCPMCGYRFTDPMQEQCYECKSTFTVDYLSGKITPVDEAARCVLCRSTFAVQKPTDPSDRNVPNVKLRKIPSQCPFCTCIGSVLPINDRKIDKLH